MSPLSQSIKAVLDRPYKEAIVAEATIRGVDTAILRLPINQLPAAEHPVRLSVRVGHDLIYQGEDILVKRSPAPDGVRVVQVDRYRRILVVDGQPWFAMGVLGIFLDYLEEASRASRLTTLGYPVGRLPGIPATRSWSRA